MSVADLA
jgi:hypothetical protein